MNAFLETGISLVLIFFIFSIITYVIQELIAVNLKYRSKMLWKSMSQLFDGFKLEGRLKLLKSMPIGNTPNTNNFYDHAQIKSLQKDLDRRPNYIPASNFALAVMDIVAKQAPVTTNHLFEDFRAGLRKFVNSNGKLYEVLKNLLATSSDKKELQQKIEDWFNNYMNRVTGWYESHTVVSVRLIAVALTLIFNINVIKLAKTIYNDGQLRSSLVAMSERIVDHPETITPFYTKTFEQLNETKKAGFLKRLAEAPNDSVRKIIKVEMDTSLGKLAEEYTNKQRLTIDSLTKGLKSAGLPLGWEKRPSRQESFWEAEGPTDNWGTNFLLALIGWIIGACCISMGAPFWFDMLNKLVNVRRSGLKPGK
jgi:hypothetical protein